MIFQQLPPHFYVQILGLRIAAGDKFASEAPCVCVVPVPFSALFLALFGWPFVEYFQPSRFRGDTYFQG